MSVKIEGLEKMLAQLERLSKLDFNPVLKKNITEIFNRASRPPGTPRDTGELIQSRRIEFNGNEASFGYTKEYAPHVEYGHLIPSGGYIAGQFYLRNNFEEQIKILEKDLKNHIKGA